MASDQVVWDIINQQFCSFKLRTATRAFCRNEYNVTGLCSRQSCPLANSRYATVRAHGDRIYLYMKTIERAHMPSKLWERIKLSQNYAKALKQIDERLIYWPKFLIHKCKQRLTKNLQALIRARRITAEEMRLGEKLVPKLAPKIQRREDGRERKALAAAKIERTIERELLERLRQGAYGDDQPLNVSEEIWKKVLNNLEREGKGVRDEEAEADVEEEMEEEQEDANEVEGMTEYVSDFDESDEELADIEDWLGSEEDNEDEESEEDESESEPKKRSMAKTKSKAKRGRVVRKKPRRKEVEVEAEAEGQTLKLLAF